MLKQKWLKEIREERICVTVLANCSEVTGIICDPLDDKVLVMKDVKDGKEAYISWNEITKMKIIGKKVDEAR